MNRKRIPKVGLICLWLLICCLLTGCMPVLQEGTRLSSVAEIRANTTCPLADEEIKSSVTAVLCFLDHEMDHIVRVPRVFEVAENDRESMVLAALLAGPSEGEAGVWPEVTGRTPAEVQVSGSIVTVNLPSRYRQLEPAQLFAVRTAIAETMLLLPDISYVNVLVGDREEGVDLAGSLPAGTLTRRGDNRISASLAEYEEIRTSGSIFTSLVTLYLPAKTGNLLLPVVRTVRFEEASAISYMNKLLEELGKSDTEEALGLPNPLEYLEEMPEIVRKEGRADKVISLHFTKELTDALLNTGLSEGRFASVVVMTLLSYIPNIDGIEMTIDGHVPECLELLSASSNVRATPEILRRSDFTHLLGAVVTGYRANETGVKLRRFSMVLPASSQKNARARLEELLTNDEAKATFPSTASAEDVLAIRTERDRFVINLSEQMGKALLGMSPDELRLCIYAMVNTLTEGLTQSRVVFFFGGNQLDSGNEIELRGQFVRSIGLVEE